MDVRILPVLKQSKKFLQTHKWGRGQYYNAETRQYCAVGAIRVVIAEGEYIDYYGELAQSVEDYLRNCTPAAIGVIDFNDHLAKNKKDVLNVFSCAIEKAEKELANAEL